MKARGLCFLAALLASSCMSVDADYGVREPVEEDIALVEDREPGEPQPRLRLKPVEPKPPAVVEWELGLPKGALDAQLVTDYAADAGDLLSVLFVSHPKMSQEVVVTPDGSVFLNMLGSLPIRGKTLAEIEKSVVAMAVGTGLRDPKVSVLVKTVTKKYITVVGPGLAGGRVEIQGRGTIIETLAGSGWKPDKRANRSVALVRNGRTSVIDLDQITGLSNVPLNIKLQANDILILMDRDPFEIKGSVNSPGTYAIPAQGDISLRDAVALAGGLKYPVDLLSVHLMRADGSSEVIDVNAYLFGREQDPDKVVLRAGDTVFFPPQREFSIFIMGMVASAGIHKVPGPVTVSRALAIANHARFGAVLDDCRLVRGYPAKPEVIRVDFEKVFAGDLASNLVMYDGDVLYVPESVGSDVLDTLARTLGPIAGAASFPMQVYTATKIGD